MATLVGTWLAFYGLDGVYRFFVVIAAHPSCLFDLITWINVALIFLASLTAIVLLHGSRMATKIVLIPIFVLWIAFHQTHG